MHWGCYSRVNLGCVTVSQESLCFSAWRDWFIEMNEALNEIMSHFNWFLFLFLNISESWVKNEQGCTLLSKSLNAQLQTYTHYKHLNNSHTKKRKNPGYLHRISVCCSLWRFQCVASSCQSLLSNTSRAAPLLQRLRFILQISSGSKDPVGAMETLQLPLHKDAAAESRHLLLRSMKRPSEPTLSQLCFRASRSNLLSPCEQRRRSWTRCDRPSRPELSQGPDTWQPVGPAASTTFRCFCHLSQQFGLCLEET